MMNQQSNRFSAARLRANVVMGPGTASNFINPFGSIRRGDNVVLWLRVSIQQNKTHMAAHEIALRRACENAGASVSGIFFM